MRLNNIFGKITDKNPAKYRGSLLLALVFFYFVFHLITGERGLLAYVQLKGEIESQKKEFILTQRDKDRLASRVVGLRSESLDLDLLEEVTRKDLGYSKKDEVVYFIE